MSPSIHETSNPSATLDGQGLKHQASERSQTDGQDQNATKHRSAQHLPLQADSAVSEQSAAPDPTHFEAGPGIFVPLPAGYKPPRRPAIPLPSKKKRPQDHVYPIYPRPPVIVPEPKRLQLTDLQAPTGASSSSTSTSTSTNPPPPNSAIYKPRQRRPAKPRAPECLADHHIYQLFLTCCACGLMVADTVGARPEKHHVECSECGHNICEECVLVFMDRMGRNELWSGEDRGTMTQGWRENEAELEAEIEALRKRVGAGLYVRGEDGRKKKVETEEGDKRKK